MHSQSTNNPARMAELADATVSNTVGEILTGSIPVPGTEMGRLTTSLLFSISHPSQLIGLFVDKFQQLIVRVGSIFVYLRFNN